MARKRRKAEARARARRRARRAACSSPASSPSAARTSTPRGRSAQRLPAAIGRVAHRDAARAHANSGAPSRWSADAIERARALARDPPRPGGRARLPVASSAWRSTWTTRASPTTRARSPSTSRWRPAGPAAYFATAAGQGDGRRDARRGRARRGLQHAPAPSSATTSCTACCISSPRAAARRAPASSTCPWLESQAVDAPGEPSMALATMVRGVEAAIAAALAVRADDVKMAAGKLD